MSDIVSIILMVINVNQFLKLDYNLLNTTCLAKKYIEIFLKKNSHIAKIIINNMVFGFANIIEN